MEVLRYGDTGYMVKVLQLALKRAGMETGNLDGIFGRNTHKALLAFQKQQGLSSDGVVGKMTWAALFPYLTGYTLRVAAKGDTVESLAKAYGVSPEAVRTANPQIGGGEALQAGETLTIPLSFPVVSADIPFSHLLNALFLEGLAARYPFIKVTSVGVSVMGRELLQASIGIGPKQVSYNASHHANEWITTSVLLTFLEDYASAYAGDREIGGQAARELYEKTALLLVPLVNPDGVDLVTGAIPPEDSYYKQAQGLSSYYPDIPFPSGWKANILGVDLNLQYPAGWEEAREVKFAQGYTRPGPRDYVGSAPLDQPESRAMAAFTEENSFSLILAYHTQGKVIFWKYKDYDPAGAYEIGLAFSKSSGYLLEQTPPESGNAGYKDWFIQQYLKPGYTIEAGEGVSPLPLDQFPQIYCDNLGILVQGLALAP